jgi:putative nucleotidyltransferase with HDIG domain
MALARDPSATTEILARVVATDPALAARVLTMSRSVTYLRRQPPRTLQEAIVTVGMQGLRRILIAASARSAYHADDTVAQTLWAHALATGLAADEIGKASGAGGGDAFIAGLLHDIGKLIFHLADPKAFAQLGWFDADRERALFGVTHDKAGACLAEMWGLDDAVVRAIMYHHDDDPGSELGAFVARGDRIATGIGCPSVVGETGLPDGGADDPLADRVRELFESERSLFD